MISEKSFFIFEQEAELEKESATYGSYLSKVPTVSRFHTLDFLHYDTTSLFIGQSNPPNQKGEQVNGLTPFDQVQGFVDFFTTFWDKNFILAVFVLGIAYLSYLFVALYYHRRDQRRLVRVAFKYRVNIRHNFSWRGVTAEVTHPVQENTGITESPGREG